MQKTRSGTDEALNGWFAHRDAQTATHEKGRRVAPAAFAFALDGITPSSELRLDFFRSVLGVFRRGLCVVSGVSSVLGSSVGAGSRSVGSGVGSSVGSDSGVVGSSLGGVGDSRVSGLVGSSLRVGSGVGSAFGRAGGLVGVAASSQSHTQSQGKQSLVDRHCVFLV